MGLGCVGLKAETRTIGLRLGLKARLRLGLTLPLSQVLVMGERGIGEMVDLQASVSELQANVCRTQAHLQGARAVAATAAARHALSASHGGCCGGEGEGEGGGGGGGSGGGGVSGGGRAGEAGGGDLAIARSAAVTAAAEKSRRCSTTSASVGLSETYTRAGAADLSRWSFPGSALVPPSTPLHPSIRMRVHGLLGAAAEARSPRSQHSPSQHRAAELGVELSPRRSGKAAPGLGEDLPPDFMQGLKFPQLPEGAPETPLRAFARFEQGLMTSPLYAGREEPAPPNPALNASLNSSTSTAQLAHDASRRLESASAKLCQSQSLGQFSAGAAASDDRLKTAPSGPDQRASASRGGGSCGGGGPGQRQLSHRAASSPSLTSRAASSHTLSSPALRDTAAACTRTGAEPSLKPSHACRRGAPGRGAAFASASATALGATKQAGATSWAGEAGWVRGGLGTQAVAASSSRRQRNPYPSPVLLSPAPSSSIGGSPPKRPRCSDSRRNPTFVAAAPSAKAAAPNDAEDLWEDLCRTLREL